MSLATYKVLHILGVILLFTGVGGLCVLSIAGSESAKARKLASIIHGIALVIILIAGFGLLVKLGFGTEIPGWIWIKLVIWAVLAGAVFVLRKSPQLATPLLFLLPLLGAIAGYLAISNVP
jgi:uncharacterized membrane protein